MTNLRTAEIDETGLIYYRTTGNALIAYSLCKNTNTWAVTWYSIKYRNKAAILRAAGLLLNPRPKQNEQEEQ